MSYTMMLDMPQKEASYVARHREQFFRELNAIALVIVRARMRCEQDDLSGKIDFAADWGRFQVRDGELDLSRGIESIRDVDFG